MKKSKIFYGIIIMFAVVTIVTVTLIIFSKVQDKDLYETDIVGEWKRGEDISIEFTKTESIVQMYGVNERSNYTLEDIEKNFQYIEGSALLPEYKYYNTLGNYYKTNGIPDTSTFDLIVFSEGGVYKVEFTADGTYISSTRSDINTEEYTVDFTCHYAKKENILYNAENNYVLYYIIDGGLYNPIYYKVK